MARTPVIRIGSTLVVTVLEDLHDRDALNLQTDLLGQLEVTGANGVLLDLSVVEIVDSFLGRLLNDIAAGVRLLGAQMVVVGIQPAVAITLVELGLELRGVRAAVSTDRGLALLRRLVNADRQSIINGTSSRGSGGPWSGSAGFGSSGGFRADH